jgi:hypothetical protein
LAQDTKGRPMPGSIHPHIRKFFKWNDPPSFKENDLFRGVPQLSQHNACVGNNGGPYDLYDYAHGYFESTRLLLEQATAPLDAEKPRIIIDTLVYPICLSFRHAIELYIKYLITDLAKVVKSKDTYKTNHSLSDNWETAKKLIKQSKLEVTEDELKLFDTAVKCIMDVDAYGATFRYPESIKGDQHLKDWSLINLVALKVYRNELFQVAERWERKVDRLKHP